MLVTLNYLKEFLYDVTIKLYRLRDLAKNT